ncbi:hypothetical protein ACTZGI_02835 [Rahnella aceris]|uniref:hypothetical protein n=1 Tax=Rahnella sp. (strain Y9602) TaxID=2703885 RepID=UPI003FCF3901
MSLTIEAAKLVNRVVYTTDLSSLKKIKEDMKVIQEMMKKGVSPDISKMVNNTKSITQAKQAAVAQARAYNTAYAKAIQPVSVKGQIFPNATPHNPALYQAQTAGMYNMKADDAAKNKAKIDAARQKQVVAIRKKNIQLELAAALKMNDLQFKINNLQGLDVASKYQALKAAQQITEQYRLQNSSLKEMNQASSHLLANQRKIARTNQIARTKGKYNAMTQPQGAGGLLGLLSSGRAMLGGIGAYGGYRAYQAASQTIQEQTTVGHKLSTGAKAVGTSPLVLQALTAWGRQNGVDSADNPDKIQDNFKDIQDKSGDFLNNATYNAKTKKYSGGGAMTGVVNRLGLSRDQVKANENNPLAQLQYIMAMAQKMGLSEKEIFNLIESLGDDLGYYVPILKDNMKGLANTMGTLNDSGAAWTESQLETVDKMRNQSTQIDQAGDSVAKAFTVAFGGAIQNVDGFTQIIKDGQPAMAEFGKSLGEMVSGLNKFAGWLHNNVTSPEAQQAGQNVMGGFLSTTGMQQNQQDWANNSSIYASKIGIRNPDSFTSNPSPVINLNPTLVAPPANVNIVPDGTGFERFLSVQMDNKMDAREQYNALSIYGTTTSN